MTDTGMLACAKLADEIIEAAHLATESYFVGENKTKRSIRQDMENLRSLVSAYARIASAITTTRIEKPQ